MELRPTALPGVVEVVPRVAQDARGRFVKVFHEELFAEHGLETHFAEQYHSTSVRGVVRGLHFQTPPAAHAKLVFCVAGSVWDVALDLREGPGFGRHVALELSAERGNALVMPVGVAHGFCTPREPATLVYDVATVYSPEHDTGVRWDSAGIPWPVDDPLLSDRDRSFPALGDFATPFA